MFIPCSFTCKNICPGLGLSLSHQTHVLQASLAAMHQADGVSSEFESNTEEKVMDGGQPKRGRKQKEVPQWKKSFTPTTATQGKSAAKGGSKSASSMSKPGDDRDSMRAMPAAEDSLSSKKKITLSLKEYKQLQYSMMKMILNSQQRARGLEGISFEAFLAPKTDQDVLSCQEQGVNYSKRV